MGKLTTASLDIQLVIHIWSQKFPANQWPECIMGVAEIYLYRLMPMKFTATLAHMAGFNSEASRSSAISSTLGFS
jgi:hypothetical protein